MLPLTLMPAGEMARLGGLLFDLDDTLLDHGRLEQRAYAALHELARAGFSLIAVTGRPARYGELFAGLWPVDAVITENGAMAFRRDQGRVVRIDTATLEERRERSERLTDLVSAARAALPELVPADDTWGRLSDFAFDIGEYQRAPESLVREAMEFAQARGARTTRSSVHLHFTFDQHDKASGVLAYLSALGEDPTRARHRYVYVGDSTNDAPCFSAFVTTVAVQNLAGVFSLLPRYLASGARSQGFCELAQHLLSGRP